MKMPPCECGQPGAGWNDDGDPRCEECLYSDYADDTDFDDPEDDPDFV